MNISPEWLIGSIFLTPCFGFSRNGDAFIAFTGLKTVKACFRHSVCLQLGASFCSVTNLPFLRPSTEFGDVSIDANAKWACRSTLQNTSETPITWQTRDFGAGPADFPD